MQNLCSPPPSPLYGKDGTAAHHPGSYGLGKGGQHIGAGCGRVPSGQAPQLECGQDHGAQGLDGKRVLRVEVLHQAPVVEVSNKGQQAHMHTRWELAPVVQSVRGHEHTCVHDGNGQLLDRCAPGRGSWGCPSRRRERSAAGRGTGSLSCPARWCTGSWARLRDRRSCIGEVHARAADNVEGSTLQLQIHCSPAPARMHACGCRGGWRAPTRELYRSSAKETPTPSSALTAACTTALVSGAQGPCTDLLHRRVSEAPPTTSACVSVELLARLRVTAE